MSFRLAVEAFDAKVGNPLRKLVLLKLADQANDDGLCWPSYETVAKACEVDRRSVIRHIKKLEEDGFLRIERVYDKKAKKNKSNRYHLTISNGDIKSLVTESHHPSDRELPPGSVTESLGSVTKSPKPISEPINIQPINESNTNVNEVINSIPPSFDGFWNIYNKKIGKSKCADKWAKISNSDKELIMKNLPDYLASIKDKQFQKHPLTYLNNESWLDEIITSQPNQLVIKGHNNATSHTPHQSPASSNMQQLRNKFAAEQSARQSNNQHDQELRTVRSL